VREADTQVGNWRTELGDALTELREAVAAEETRRIADHNNITDVITASRSRMAKIASDIDALRRKAAAVRIMYIYIYVPISISISVSVISVSRSISISLSI
jgi:hypothetical protein